MGCREGVEWGRREGEGGKGVSGAGERTGRERRGEDGGRRRVGLGGSREG